MCLFSWSLGILEAAGSCLGACKGQASLRAGRGAWQRLNVSCPCIWALLPGPLCPASFGLSWAPCTHKHTNTHIYGYLHIQAHTSIRAHIHRYTHKDTYKHSQIHTNTHIYRCTHTYTQEHTYTYSSMHTHIHIGAFMHPRRMRTLPQTVRRSGQTSLGLRLFLCMCVLLETTTW